MSFAPANEIMPSEMFAIIFGWLKSFFYLWMFLLHNGKISQPHNGWKKVDGWKIGVCWWHGMEVLWIAKEIVEKKFPEERFSGRHLWCESRTLWINCRWIFMRFEWEKPKTRLIFSFSIFYANFVENSIENFTKRKFRFRRKLQWEKENSRIWILKKIVAFFIDGSHIHLHLLTPLKVDGKMEKVIIAMNFAFHWINKIFFLLKLEG